MRIKHIFLTSFAVFLPALCPAQDAEPNVAPTATYIDSEGTETVSDGAISGQAPLEVTFRANPSGIGAYTPTYSWHFRMEGEEKDLMVRYEEDTRYTFTTAGTTLVTLEVDLGPGNKTSIPPYMFSVTISESKLSFPNAFSPNGDMRNDIYKAKEHQSIVEFHAYIFNRWGQKLFEWTDPDGGWDGTYNGQDVKEGVYFVLVKARGADGHVYNIRKDVNLMRGYTETTNNN